MGKRKKYDLTDMRLPDFTQRFRKRVDALGGVTKVSEITGISRPTINFWYNGQRTPDAESLITLSKKLGVSSDWLLGLLPDDNATNDEKLRMVSELTGLSNDAILMIDRLSTVAFGKKAVDTLISSPQFYRITSYLSTYFFGYVAEEFTGQDEGLISTLRFIKDDDLFKQYIQPAMLSKITEMLVDIKRRLDEGSVE